MKQLKENCLLLTGALCLVILAVYGAGLLVPQEAVSTDFIHARQSPSWQHPFGTDNLGRDILLRTLKGMSVSVTVGIVASCISAVIGILIGIAAAAGSRMVDSVINWVIDLMMGIPHTVLIILISFSLGRGMKGLLTGIAATHWTSLARLIRGEVLQLREAPYIKAAKKLGVGEFTLVCRHMLPHLFPQFLVGLILMFPHAILHEASITFLGFGLPPEQPAIGVILSESMKYLVMGKWWLAVFPGLLLVATVMLFDVAGESLRKLLDPGSAHM